jgi:cell cycle sensor histidine kinase DivJ
MVIILAHVAILMTGGLIGPLAIWCLLPLIAVINMRRDRALPEAAGLTVLSIGGLGLLHAAGLIGRLPEPGWNLLLSILGLLGLASVFVACILTRSPPALADIAALDGFEALLSQLPSRLLVLSERGSVRRAFGSGPDWLDPGAQSLAAMACLDDRPMISQALAQAARLGAAQIAFRSAALGHGFAAAEIRTFAGGGFLVLIRDATEAQRRELGLIKAREAADASSAARARFLANMSHELRTPLNAIMGFSDIMRSRMFGPLTGKYSDYAGLIHEAGSHLLDLINDVLDMSKIEAERYELSLEVVDAREPITAALRLLRLQADEAGIRLRGVLPPAALEANLDRRAIKQIVINLVANALKFTPKGGEVTVTLQAYSNSLELIVSDTGIGIGPDDLARLGRPYVQAKINPMQAEGTGLGLSLVRALAQLHGGDMTLESRLGEGTAVTIRLPGALDPQLPLELPRAAE